MSVAPPNMGEFLSRLWVDGRWRDLLCYTFYQDLVDDALDDLRAAEENLTWCFHGTSLTIAHKIFEEGGLRAGVGTHLNETGVFVFGRKADHPYSFAHCWKLARNRAKCHFCSEWYTHQAPSAWSMPVVIMFPYATGDLTRLIDYKKYSSSKYVINRPVGSYVWLPQVGARLLLCYHEYLAWCRVHAVPHCNVPRCILKDDDSEDLIMCGGRLDDPFHWSRSDCEPHASCGRICRVRDLKSAGWKYSRNVRNSKRRIFRCPVCHGDASYRAA